MALTVIVGGLLYLLAPVLTPFAIAALFAYLCDPLVDRLEERFSRSLSVSLVFLLFILLWVLALLILVPMLERQVVKLFEQFPKWVAYLQEAILPRIEQYTGASLERLDPSSLVEILRKHWQQAGGFAQNVLGGLSKSGMALLAFVANLVLLPVLIFYLLRDWDILIERIRELLPRAVEPTISRLARQADEVLGAFLRGQLSVMVALGTIYSVGLMMVGIDLGLLIGMVAGLISFIPYLGAIVGVGAGVIAALVQYGDLWHVLLVLAVFGVGQTVESFLLTPWLVGDKIGLHPVAVIFAIMAGGQLFGFFGVLLALPVAAVAMVVLRYLHERYTASALYGGRPPPPAEVPPPAELDAAASAPAQKPARSRKPPRRGAPNDA
nr:AI-2E family transporter [Lysobacter sp. CAU 1642]